MSLINKMLQDLEARRAPGIEGVAVPGQVRPVPPSTKMHPLWWILMLILVGTIAVLAWLLLPALKVSEPLAPPQLAGPLEAAAPMPATVHNTEASKKQSRELAPALPIVPPKIAPAITGNNIVAAPAPKAESLPSDTRPISSAPPIAASEVVASPAQANPESVALKAPKGLDRQPEFMDESGVVKHMRTVTPQQRAENEYRKSLGLLQQGRVSEAIVALTQALQTDSHHLAARQTLVGLLVEGGRLNEAQQQLQEALKLSPEQSGFAMMLARLQVDKGETTAALETLQHSLPYATEKADYRAFMAALLQRQERHKEAIAQYEAALKRAPGSGVWLMGLAISLQADKRLAEAQEAYARAAASGNLSADLQAFVEQRSKQLQQQSRQ